MRKSIFDEMVEMQEEMDSLFERLNRQTLLPIQGTQLTQRKFRLPEIQINQTETGLNCEVELPGANKEDINLQLTNDGMEVTVEKKEHQEVKEEGYYSYSTMKRNYYRKIDFPVKIDASKAEADYKNGVLKIKAPKLAIEGKRTLQIK